MTQQQKFHTDDVNLCLHNKSGNHGFYANLFKFYNSPGQFYQFFFNFTILLIGKVLCSSANELQWNSNASS